VENNAFYVALSFTDKPGKHAALFQIVASVAYSFAFWQTGPALLGFRLVRRSRYGAFPGGRGDCALMP